MQPENRFKSWREFWPYYLSQHAKPITQYFHCAGMLLGVTCAAFSLVSQKWVWLSGWPVLGYGLAWLSHFAFEKNKPATFEYPLWSLMGDFKMCALVLMGKRPVASAPGTQSGPKAPPFFGTSHKEELPQRHLR